MPKMLSYKNAQSPLTAGWLLFHIFGRLASDIKKFIGIMVVNKEVTDARSDLIVIILLVRNSKLIKNFHLNQS
jgi:hypothetical protein